MRMAAQKSALLTLAALFEAAFFTFFDATGLAVVVFFFGVAFFAFAPPRTL